MNSVNLYSLAGGIHSYLKKSELQSDYQQKKDNSTLGCNDYCEKGSKSIVTPSCQDDSKTGYESFFDNISQQVSDTTKNSDSTVKNESDPAKKDETNSKLKSLAEKAKQVEEVTKQIGEMIEGNKKSSIVNKLYLGYELSGSEMSYLANKDPSMYQEACQANKIRVMYRMMLNSQSTKESVRDCHTIFVLSLSSNLRGNSGSSCSGVTIATINNEYESFSKSSKFRSLPSNADIQKKKQEKKAEAHRKAVREYQKAQREAAALKARLKRNELEKVARKRVR